MHDEMASMCQNCVWDLVKLLCGYKPIGCKYVFKTKFDSEGQVEMYKVRLIAEGYN